MATGHGFWLTNRIANPVLRRLLRTSAGGRLGRRLMVLRYTGTVTGRPRELVVQYARDGGTAWVLVGSPDRKTWWHNLHRPADVDVWLAGQRARARAEVVRGNTDPDQAAAGLAACLRTVPPAAASADVDTVVLVRVDLTGPG